MTSAPTLGLRAFATAFVHDAIEEHRDGLAEIYRGFPLLRAEERRVIILAQALTRLPTQTPLDYFVGILGAGRAAVATKLAVRIATLEACFSSSAHDTALPKRYLEERELFDIMRVDYRLAPMWKRLHTLYRRAHPEKTAGSLS